ncbi:hypothetical protein JRO89_XS15G0145400 [Xanthoceras sorbifolium]|uniref:PGG domain-containing protein n=1 Tax=Xanthoceras sorbifolium TaxID=99658 RepID=A0ABQ8H292_9ROSI|nr:hypothetical protein JRO89_XS15G0145400 [Xanthoceras sorbifolium]
MDSKLFKAFRRRNVYQINKLAGGNPHIFQGKSPQGNTALHLAARLGDKHVVKEILRLEPSFLYERNRNRETPMHIAAKAGNASVIEEHPSSLNYRGLDDLTLLHCAGIRQNYDSKKKGELINTLDVHGRTPLHYAAVLGNAAIARRLLQADASSSLGHKGDCNGQTPLHLAAENGQYSVFIKLVNGYPDAIDVLDGKQRSILHLAALNGNVKTVQFILTLPEMEDLMNSIDEDGNTPLHLAAMNFHGKVVDILSKNERVNIRATNYKQLTALTFVQSSTDPHSDTKKQYSTVKILKEAIRMQAFYPGDILQYRSFHAMEKDVTQNRYKENREMAQTLLVMATLIASFTFTVAFTIPGGYKSDNPNEGMALLVRKPGLQAFVITVTVAMISSMIAAVLTLGQIGYENDLSYTNMDVIPLATSLIWLGLMSMSLAFVTGLFLVFAFPVLLYLLWPFFGVQKYEDITGALLHGGSRISILSVVLEAWHLLPLGYHEYGFNFDFDLSELFYLLESAGVGWKPIMDSKLFKAFRSARLSDKHVVETLLRLEPSFLYERTETVKLPCILPPRLAMLLLLNLHSLWLLIKVLTYMAWFVIKEHPSSLDYRGLNDLTLLHCAVIRQNYVFVAEIVQRKMEVINTQDEYGRNPLHYAAVLGNVAIARRLLQADGSSSLGHKDLINSADGDGNTPLHLAAMNFHENVVDILSKKERQYLTVKILKETITLQAFYPEDILEDGRFRAMEKEVRQIRHKENSEMCQTLLVMATLIASFTFTVAFTIPEGYKNDSPDEGMAILFRKSGLQAFVITVTVAMISSMTAAVFALGQIRYGNDESYTNVNLIPLATALIWLGLLSMSLAFVTGLFLVLSNNMPLAIVVVCIGCAFPFLLYVFGPFFGVQTFEITRALLHGGAPMSVCSTRSIAFYAIRSVKARFL